LTAAAKAPSVINGYGVSNIQAVIIKPYFPVNAIVVTSGTPYIACNATKNGNNINDTEMQLDLQHWYLVNKKGVAPYNTTEIDQVGVSNVHHDRDTGWSQVVFSLGYEDELALRDGLLFVYPLLQSNTTAVQVFPQHQFRECKFYLNGWGPQAQIKGDSNFALIFGLALGLSLLALICIGIGTGYYYFYVKPRRAAKNVDKDVKEFDLDEHPADQYDELGRPYFYDADGQPYFYDESGRPHYYYDTHFSEAPMFDELGRQFFYSEDGQPYFINDKGQPEFYYDDEGNSKY